MKSIPFYSVNRLEIKKLLAGGALSISIRRWGEGSQKISVRSHPLSEFFVNLWGSSGGVLPSIQAQDVDFDLYWELKELQTFLRVYLHWDFEKFLNSISLHLLGLGKSLKFHLCTSLRIWRDFELSPISYTFIAAQKNFDHPVQKLRLNITHGTFHPF